MSERWFSFKFWAIAMLVEITCGQDPFWYLVKFRYVKRSEPRGTMQSAPTSFFENFGRLCQSWTPITQKNVSLCFCVANESALVCFLCSDSCRRTHVWCQQRFLQNHSCYLMYLPNPTRVFVKHIFYLSNFCSYEQFFETWFVVVDNANVVGICESTEPCRSFRNLRH